MSLLCHSWKHAQNRRPFSSTHPRSCWVARGARLMFVSRAWEASISRLFEKYFPQPRELYLVRALICIFHATQKWAVEIAERGLTRLGLYLEHGRAGYLQTFRVTGVSICFQSKNTKLLNIFFRLFSCYSKLFHSKRALDRNLVLLHKLKLKGLLLWFCLDQL